MAEKVILDDFTGTEAQRDDEFLSEGFEKIIAGKAEEFDVTEDLIKEINYNQFIIFSKKNMADVIRIVEPWSKAAVSQYGKCLKVTSSETDIFIEYINEPFYFRTKLVNKSGKSVPTFYINIQTLKRITVEAFSSVVFVFENQEFNIVMADSLLFVETLDLDPSLYKRPVVDTELKSLDIELLKYTHKKLGFVLGLTDRASERNLIVTNHRVVYNTGVFQASLNSPYGDEEFVLYKSAVDTISVAIEISKLDVKFAIQGDVLKMVFDSTTAIYLPITHNITDFIPLDFFNTINFEGGAKIQEQAFVRMLGIAKSFDYLSDIVTLKFTSTLLNLQVQSSSLERKSLFEFPVVGDGKFAEVGELKVSASLLFPYFTAIGNDVSLQYSSLGLGIKSDQGYFLIRSSV